MKTPLLEICLVSLCYRW